MSKLFNQLNFLEKEAFEKLDVNKIYLIWQSNHQILLNYLLDNEIKYFGLHGTPISNYQEIITKKNCNIELATFYNKEKSELRLIQLYDTCYYVFNYTLKNRNEGKIMVFNLESKEGRNASMFWEKLKPIGGYLDNVLINDTKEQKKIFSSIINNKLDRTDFVFTDSQSIENGDKIKMYSHGYFTFNYKGCVNIDKIFLNKYMSELRFNNLDINGDLHIIVILRNRIMCQEILAQVFDLI